MNLKKKAKKALPYSMGISLLNLVISMFGMVYLVQYLEEVEYGTLGLFTGLPLMINIALSLGYDSYISRYIPQIEDKKEVSTIVWRIVLRRMLLAGLVSAGLVFTFPYFSPYFKISEYYEHFIAYQGAMLFFFGFIYVRLALHARFLQKYLFFLRIFYQVIWVSAILYGVFTKKDFYYFMVAFSVVEFVHFTAGVIFFSIHHSMPSIKGIFQRREEPEEEKSYRKISYVNALGTSFLGTDIDRYILGYFSNPTQVAIYVLATRILKKLLFFYPLKMFKPIAEPTFYSKYDQTDNETELNRMFQFIFNANNMVGFLFLTLFLPVGKELMLWLFKKPYTAEAYLPLAIFLFFVVFYSIPLGMVSKAIKKPIILLYSKVSIVLNIALGIPLAYKYGAWGMALATAISVILKNAIIYILINRHISLSIPWISAIRSLVNTALTVGFVLILKAYVIQNIFLLGAISAVVYFFTTKINPIFTPEQKKLLSTLVPKKFKSLAEFIF